MKSIYVILAVFFSSIMVVSAQESSDELSRLHLNQASRATIVNGDNSFLQYQGARGTGTDTIKVYESLTRREFKRKLRYDNLKRQEASLTKMQNIAQASATSQGYAGIIKNFSPYRGYNFQIIPVNGGEKMSAYLNPGDECKTELVAGTYIGIIMDGGREIGRTVFSVPKRTYFENEWTSWCFYKKRM